MKKSIRITAVLIALLAVLCLLLVSCSEKQQKKKYFKSIASTTMSASMWTHTSARLKKTEHIL